MYIIFVSAKQRLAKVLKKGLKTMEARNLELRVALRERNLIENCERSITTV